jgi:predicted RNase H-like nuclease (RuvC/YqgF family)
MNMPDPTVRVSNENLQAQIKGLGIQIEDIKRLLVGNEDRIRSLERAGDKTTPLIEKRIEILEKTAEAHSQELEDLKDMITTQAQSIKDLTNSFETMQKIWKWALGIFTAVMIAVIILFITGQATMVFK